MRLSSALLGLFASLSIAIPAIAHEEEQVGDRYRHYPLGVEGHVSPFGGPLGMAGAALDFALIPELSLAAGFGAGGFATQWVAGIRPRIPNAPGQAVSFSLLYSFGDYKRFSLDFGGNDGQCLFRDASWVNVDIGYEWRFRSHILLRPYLGFSQLFASQKPVWHEAGNVVPGYTPMRDDDRWPMLFYVGLALGVDLGLREYEYPEQ